MSERTGIVTPEAVVLDFATAGVGSRVAAQVLDFMVQGVALFISVMALTIFADPGGWSWVGTTIAFFLVFGITFGYSVLFETFMQGRTPGKAAMGLQVVTLEGGPISFRHAAIRGAFGVIEVYATSGALAFLVVLFSKRSQRIGDIVAGTLVFRQRSGSSDPVATRFVPFPGTEEFVATLDVSSLTTDEYQTVRSFLLRSAKLDARARDSLALQLGNQMAARLRATPPQGMTALQFLVSVASAYQRRFQQG